MLAMQLYGAPTTFHFAVAKGVTQLLAKPIAERSDAEDADPADSVGRIGHG